MFDLDKYLADLILNCRSAFGERLLYMGLQGSWLRGEAHENSDIDIMVILDRFSVRDMDTYRGILREIGFYERSCGFICGEDEMKRWNPLEPCLIKLLPVLHIPAWLYAWIGIIALIKVVNIISGLAVQKKLVAVHSVMNKATGVLLFLLPLTIPAVPLRDSAIVTCAAATFAAIQEGHFIRTGRE